MSTDGTPKFLARGSTPKKLSVVELYAGTARAAEPFRAWQRCEVSLLIDSDPFAKQTYLYNHPGAPYLGANLLRLSAGRIREVAGGRIDVLLGCPPCQGFSDVGARDPNDPRNFHLRRFGHFVSVLQPRAVVMENVPLAVSGTQFQQFIAGIERAGYVWTAGIVNAALRGSTQCRQRLVFIAVHEDLRVDPRIPAASHGGSEQYFSYRHRRMMSLREDRLGMLGEAPATQRLRGLLPFSETRLGDRAIPAVADVLDDLPRVGTRHAERVAHHGWAHSPKQLRRMGAVPEGGRWPGAADHFSQTYGRLHRRGLSRTITTQFNNPGSGRYWHPTQNRAITPREAARIQGFPDSFMFLPPFSRAATLIGNALDSYVASMGYEIVRACLE